jgi:hypothetical protein
VPKDRKRRAHEEDNLSHDQLRQNFQSNERALYERNVEFRRLTEVNLKLRSELTDNRAIVKYLENLVLRARLRRQ